MTLLIQTGTLITVSGTLRADMLIEGEQTAMFGTVSSDDHYTGHKAAAFGGTTTVMDFVPQDVPGFKANIDAWRAKADPRAAIDFGFHMNVTHLDDQTMAELPELVAEGITTLKVFTAYNNRLRLPDGDIFRVMRKAADYGMLTMLHAEDGDVSEALAVQAGAPLYVVHMNAAGEVDMLRYARQHGVPVMGETCPQYLFFTVD